MRQFLAIVGTWFGLSAATAIGVGRILSRFSCGPEMTDARPPGWGRATAA